MPNSPSRPTRRTFLASTAVAAATVGSVPLLSACGSGDGGGGGGGRSSTEDLESILPTYTAQEAAVRPDIPSKNGSTPGYTRYLPTDELATTVPEPRGGGGRFSAMTPLWGTPPAKGNAYWAAMDEAIGVELDWQTQDGNTYGEKLGAVLAGSDIPDLVCVPGWELHGQIPQAIEQRFADLGKFLSGDKVRDYPNLAAVPTEAWQHSVFSGALRGLPMPAAPATQIVPYYRRDLFEAAGWELPTSADEFLQFAKDITVPSAKLWACEDMKWAAWGIFGVLPQKPNYWQVVDGKLVNRYETDAYLEALEWVRKLYDAGVVHPDAVAAQGDAGNRVNAGESMIFCDGGDKWYEFTNQQRTVNPDYRLGGIPYFGHDGGDPTLWAAAPADIWMFVNKSLSDERIREALEIANFTAAPYGTLENRLVRFGIEGVHSEMQNGTLVKTDQGTEELPNTYLFMCSPEATRAHSDFPDVVEDFCSWEQQIGAFIQEPEFYGRQVQEPEHLSNLSDPFEDLEDDIVRGRGKVSDMQDAAAEWRRGGGDELREWYQKLRDEETV